MAAPCPRCGGTEILERVRLSVATGGSTGEVNAVVSPTSGMIRKQTASEVRGSICAACGYTELFVSEPEVIAERWRAGER